MDSVHGRKVWLHSLEVKATAAMEVIGRRGFNILNLGRERTGKVPKRAAQPSHRVGPLLVPGVSTLTSTARDKVLTSLRRLGLQGRSGRKLQPSEPSIITPPRVASAL